MTKEHHRFAELPPGMKRIRVTVHITQDFFVPDNDDYKDKDDLPELASNAMSIKFKPTDNEDFEPIGSFDEEWEVETV